MIVIKAKSLMIGNIGYHIATSILHQDEQMVDKVGSIAAYKSDKRLTYNYLADRFIYVPIGEMRYYLELIPTKKDEVPSVTRLEPDINTREDVARLYHVTNCYRITVDAHTGHWVSIFTQFMCKLQQSIKERNA